VDRVVVINQLAVVIIGDLVEKSILIELNEAVGEFKFMVDKVVINVPIVVVVVVLLVVSVVCIVDLSLLSVFLIELLLITGKLELTVELSAGIVISKEVEPLSVDETLLA
jgi:hypothetical protein